MTDAEAVQHIRNARHLVEAQEYEILEAIAVRMDALSGQQMRWTTERPRQTGPHWYRDEYGHEILDLEHRGGDLVYVVNGWSVDSEDYDDSEWCRIPLPQEGV